MTPDTGIPELATRGSRLSAASVDGVIGLLIVLPVCISMTTAIASAYVLQEPLVWTSAMSNSIALSLLLLLIWSAVTCVLVARNGQTIGKKALGIKVVRSDGSPASLGRIFWLRNVANMVPTMVPFVGIAYSLVEILFIYGVRQQCLHDLIADTIVVRA
jgi:uncharacterized RDD family membrane protein YckC